MHRPIMAGKKVLCFGWRGNLITATAVGYDCRLLKDGNVNMRLASHFRSVRRGVPVATIILVLEMLKRTYRATAQVVFSNLPIPLFFVFVFMSVGRGE